MSFSLKEVGFQQQVSTPSYIPNIGEYINNLGLEKKALHALVETEKFLGKEFVDSLYSSLSVSTIELYNTLVSFQKNYNQAIENRQIYGKKIEENGVVDEKSYISFLKGMYSSGYVSTLPAEMKENVEGYESIQKSKKVCGAYDINEIMYFLKQDFGPVDMYRNFRKRVIDIQKQNKLLLLDGVMREKEKDIYFQKYIHLKTKSVKEYILHAQKDKRNEQEKSSMLMYSVAENMFLIEND